MSWFWRELLKLSFLSLIAFGLLAIVITDAADRGEGAAWVVLAISFGAGAAAILSEAIIAWRRGTLFIRDRQRIEERRARNMRLSRVFIGPAVALALLLGFLPEMATIALLGLGAGYLVPLSVGMLIHFAKNHREIERLTT